MPYWPVYCFQNEIKNPHNLKITSKVNNIIKQDSNTSFQIFDIPTQIETVLKAPVWNKAVL